MSSIMLTRYKEEYIEVWERRKATLINTVRTDSIDRGGAMVFLLAGSGGRSAVGRGANGDIPLSDDSQANVTVTLKEAHDHTRKNRFNIFTAQGDQLAIMRNESIGVIHREQDLEIITAILTGTVSLGAIASMDKQVANRVATILGNADVGEEDDGHNIFAAVSNAAWAELTDIPSFASADYVRFDGMTPVEAGLQRAGNFKHWMGINWTKHNGLGGKGTSTAVGVAWHKNAVGYTTGSGGIDAEIGYDAEQDRTWRRATIFHGAVKLQNAGIVKWTHDDTALSS